jgi:hypothetical protein
MVVKQSHIVLFIISSFLSSCAMGPPSHAELISADYGSPITQEIAQRLAKNFLSARFKDPRSAQYEWGIVHKGWIREAPLHGRKLVFGYKLDVRVNAKNSFGGYVGFKPYTFIFYNGLIKTVYGQVTIVLRNSDDIVYFGKIY